MRCNRKAIAFHAKEIDRIVAEVEVLASQGKLETVVKSMHPTVLIVLQQEPYSFRITRMADFTDGSMMHKITW